MDAAQADAAITELRRWLVTEGRRTEGTGAFDQAFVDQLLAAGLPLTRFTTGIPSLHPSVDSFSTLWTPEEGIVFRQYRAADITPGQSRSPIFIAYETGQAVHTDLTAPPEPDEATIFGDLRQAGYTDYLVMPLPFSDGSFKAVSYATDEAGGFSDDDVRLLNNIRLLLATVIEARYLRHMAGVLMDTYVGPVAGRRVLDGEIKRGAGETIRAAIWFCDLKGFTALSEQLPGQQIINLLNDYFDVITPAIEAEGGEILKFIGDAVLAIFLPEGEDEAAAAARALRASAEATASLTAANAARAEAGEPQIGTGIALHFGDVVYGNVGGKARLDFTVIGPAVNLASRIEGLTREVDRPVLVSAEFAALHGGDFEPLGEFAFKGIGGKRAVYAPA